MKRYVVRTRPGEVTVRRSRLYAVLAWRPSKFAFPLLVAVEVVWAVVVFELVALVGWGRR